MAFFVMKIKLFCPKTLEHHYIDVSIFVNQIVALRSRSLPVIFAATHFSMIFHRDLWKSVVMPV